MKRPKPAIYRVRLDGCSKDERYRADNSRARAHVSHRSFRGNLPSLCPALSPRGKKNTEFARFSRHPSYRVSPSVSRIVIAAIPLHLINVLDLIALREQVRSNYLHLYISF